MKKNLKLQHTGFPTASPGARKGPWPVRVQKIDDSTYEATVDETAITFPKETAPTAEEALVAVRDAWSREMHADYGPQDFVILDKDDTTPETDEKDQTES